MSLDFIMAKSQHDKLTEAEQNFFYQSLPFILMHLGIGLITEASIKHIVARLDVLPEYRSLILKDLTHFGVKTNDSTDVDDLLTDLFTRFIGVRTNVGFESNVQFLRKIGHKLPSFTAKKANDIRRDFSQRFDKEIAAQRAAKGN